MVKKRRIPVEQKGNVDQEKKRLSVKKKKISVIKTRYRSRKKRILVRKKGYQLRKNRIAIKKKEDVGQENTGHESRKKGGYR